MLQENQPIAASRALIKAQQNYAQIEKETLAITFGCAKFHQYVYGREVIVESMINYSKQYFQNHYSKHH